MASNVTRDHHNLRRNLKLNGNYISNDGGDEGISISDSGDVTFTDSTQLPIFSFNTAGSTFKIIDDSDNPDDYFSIDVEAQGATTISTFDDSVANADLSIIPDGSLSLQQTFLYFKDSSGNTRGTLSAATADTLTIFAPVNDLFLLKASGTGGFTINTTGNAGSGDVTIESGGDINLDAEGDTINVLQADVAIPIDKKVIFGDAGEYIVGDGTDLDIVSSNNLNLGGDNLINLYDGATNYGSFSKTTGDTLSISSAAGNIKLAPYSDHYILLGGGTGFTQATPTYNATDTAVDFRDTNKQFLTFGSGSEAIADLNLQFPAVSGNFVLVIKQHSGGGGSVASDGWLVFDEAGDAANTTIVQWPGGTEPTLTTGANAVDIVSFYWDATDGAEICYGVISQDFQ